MAERAAHSAAARLFDAARLCPGRAQGGEVERACAQDARSIFIERDDVEGRPPGVVPPSTISSTAPPIASATAAASRRLGSPERLALVTASSAAARGDQRQGKGAGRHAQADGVAAGHDEVGHRRAERGRAMVRPGPEVCRERRRASWQVARQPGEQDRGRRSARGSACPPVGLSPRRAARRLRGRSSRAATP
ncbi:MAG: hypothetical protein U0232_23870 [Thermomicrobiales bacterium]